MWNFRKVINKGDTRYLYKLQDYDKLPEFYIPSEDWDNIFWEYVEAKGIDYNFKLRLEIQAKIAILESEKVFEGKPNHTKIEIEKLKLKDLQKKVKKNTDLENDAILGKFMGFPINPKITTVSQYIGFENLLKEYTKQDPKNGSNRH
jgi:hypothetical protein